MLIDAYIGVMGSVAGGFFVLWHGAILVALARTARETKWRFDLRASLRAMLVAAIIIAIVIGAMAIGIRDMPSSYQRNNGTKINNPLKLL